MQKPSTQNVPIFFTVALIFILVTLLAGRLYAQPCTSTPLALSGAGPEVHNRPFEPLAGSQVFSAKTYTGGDRSIFYIHGLGGSSENWQLVASRTAYGGTLQFPARKVVYAPPITYAQNGSLLDAALDMDAGLQSAALQAQQIHGISPEDNLLIAHSLGGLEALILDSLYQDTITFSRPFGGMILFGSAVEGSDAPFALSSWGGNGAEGFVEEACEVLSSPWLWLPQFLPPLRWFPALDPILQQAISFTCGTLGDLFVPFALGHFNKPLVAEIQPQSPWIQSISARAPSVPVIQAYGVEEEPVFWRTAYSMYMTDSIGLALAQDPFSFDGDQVLVDWAVDQMAQYAAQGALASARAQAHLIAQNNAWYNPVASLYHAWQRQRALEESAAANDAHRWYYQANNVYKGYIGARKLSFNQDGFWCRCRGDMDPPFSWTAVQTPSDCFGSDPYAACVVWERWQAYVIEKPNDGVVLAQSAGSLPGAIAHVAMPNTNHQQMRNASTTRALLKRIYNGQIPGGPFFATAIR